MTFKDSRQGSSLRSPCKEEDPLCPLDAFRNGVCSGVGGSGGTIPCWHYPVPFTTFGVTGGDGVVTVL